MNSALPPSTTSTTSEEQREGAFHLPSQILPLPSPAQQSLLAPSPGGGFCVLKWRNSLTDCCPCLILQISTNNHLSSPADLFLMSATPRLTLGSLLQMWSHCLLANTGLSLGLCNPSGLFTEMLPSSFYITKGTFLIYHQSGAVSKLRPQKLFCKPTLCTLIFIHL